MARIHSYHSREPRHPAGATFLRSAKENPADKVQVTIVLRPPSKLEAAKRSAVKLAVKQSLTGTRGKAGPAVSAGLRKSPRKFEESYGVQNECFERIDAFAKARGFRVVEKSAAGRFAILSGKLSDLSKAFGIETCTVEHEGIQYRSHYGKVQLPAEIGGIVDAVLGFDTRPVGRHHGLAHNGQPVDPRKVAAIYDFPKTLNGSGQCIGIIELGGGFWEKDIRAYFRSYKRPVPDIRVREMIGPVDSSGGKGTNNPAKPADIKLSMDLASGSETDHASLIDFLGTPAGNQVKWTIETTMDVQLVGSLAGGARIVVYFAPNTEQGKFHAWTAALTDQINKPSVISGSFGIFESQMEPHNIRTLNDLYHDAVLRGVTICCSSGDTGDGSTKAGAPHVNFPASSPFVLACGGTSLTLSRTLKKPERVWNENRGTVPFSSGGGVSRRFAMPVWQRGSGVKEKTGRNGRGIPDVAARADLKDGYHIRVGNLNIPMGGTSSAAPLWASLVAILNEKLNQNVGYLNPYLYSDDVRKGMLDIRRGRSGKRYQASKGWDACTGLGRPVAQALLDVLSRRISGE